MPSLLGRLKQAIDLARCQKIFRAFMRVGCICSGPFGSSTFPISPVGHRFPALKKFSFDAETVYHTFPKKRLFGKVGIPLDLAPGETNVGITPTTDDVTLDEIVKINIRR
jgi:hypothetical protein